MVPSSGYAQRLFRWPSQLAMAVRPITHLRIATEGHNMALENLPGLTCKRSFLIT